jgi:uncharacterized lipoprotein YbaY
MTPQDNPSAKSAPPPGGTSVHGTIEFKDVGEPARNVTVRVRVQDTSNADASAATVAEQVLEGVNILPGAPPVKFSVSGIPKKAGARYVVRVHADVDGNGAVSKGDYVTTQSYPVQDSGPATTVNVVVKKVK